ncbi:MAG: sulfite exporter TauE/SafE family protein [Acidobacteriaceae bacterium]|nr:sulfite exporter TauE/SafE family protein [Acidobacteriaceae bacterium]
MGNFSINQYSALGVRADSIEVRYVVDMAEIPTFQELQSAGLAADAKDPRVRAYATRKARELGKGLVLSAGGNRLPLEVLSSKVLFTPGAGNLPTMKIGIEYLAKMPQQAGKLGVSYKDTNFEERAGWKEVIANAAPGIRLVSSSAPRHDRSAGLTNYATDLLNSPPQQVTAKLVVDLPIMNAAVKTSPEPTPVPKLPNHQVELTPNRQETPRNAFTELIHTERFGTGVIVLCALIAVGLGALHALEPGHGKTIVAAYLVGSKGTARDAVLLGTFVTLSHTAGVYLLGAITLYAQQYVMPDRLYPYLNVLSGLFIAGLGCYLLLQRIAGVSIAHVHEHAHGDRPHSHFGFRHSHVKPHGTPAGKPSLKQLLVLGVTGGIVPCPAAVVVLLSALALHRVGFGMFLIVAFSVGLAAVLIGMGLAVIYAGRLASALPTNSPLVQRWLPATSAAIITILGCVMVVRSVVAAGLLSSRI